MYKIILWIVLFILLLFGLSAQTYTVSTGDTPFTYDIKGAIVEYPMKAETGTTVTLKQQDTPPKLEYDSNNYKTLITNSVGKTTFPTPLEPDNTVTWTIYALAFIVLWYLLGFFCTVSCGVLMGWTVEKSDLKDILITSFAGPLVAPLILLGEFWDRRLNDII